MKPCYHSIILLHFPLPTRPFYICYITPQMCLWPFCNRLTHFRAKKFSVSSDDVLNVRPRSKWFDMRWKPSMLKGIVTLSHHPLTFLDEAVSQSITSCLCLKCCHLYRVCVFLSHSFAYFHIHVPGFFFFFFPHSQEIKNVSMQLSNRTFSREREQRQHRLWVNHKDLMCSWVQLVIISDID